MDVRHLESDEEHICDETNLSFAGCGFVGIYHIGASACLQLHAPHLLRHRVGGSSAGAMCALALLCDIPLVHEARNVAMLAFKAKQNTLGVFSPSFHMHDIIKTHFESILPDDVAERVSGKLFVSLTKFSNQKNILVTQFRNKADVIDAVCASSFVPLMSGLTLPRFRGEFAMDGGLSDNVPSLGARTITVSPFTGDASICPEEQTTELWSVPQGSGATVHLSKRNLWRFKDAVIAPYTQTVQSLCAQGFSDAAKFLLSTDNIKCQECLEYPKTMAEEHFNCDHCILKKEQLTKVHDELPEEFREVFNDIINLEEEGKSLISYISILSSWSSSKTSDIINSLGQRLAMISLLHIPLVPLKCLYNIQPSIQSCPFVDL